MQIDRRVNYMIIFKLLCFIIMCFGISSVLE